MEKQRIQQIKKSASSGSSTLKNPSKTGKIIQISHIKDCIVTGYTKITQKPIVILQ